MAKAITAYLSDDGRVHLSKADADYADMSSLLADDTAKFLKEQDQRDQDDRLHNLLCRWELWKVGGLDKWLASLGMGDPEPPSPGRMLSDEHSRAAVQAVLDAPALVDTVQPQLPFASPPPPPPEAKPRAVKRPPRVEAAPREQFRKRVAIIGILGMHHGRFEKEFGKVFKLTMYDSDCVNKLAGLRQYHKVLVLTKFVNHSHVELLRSVGQEPLLIHGCIDKLRDALRQLALAENVEIA